MEKVSFILHSVRDFCWDHIAAMHPPAHMGTWNAVRLIAYVVHVRWHLNHRYETAQATV